MKASLTLFFALIIINVQSTLPMLVNKPQQIAKIGSLVLQQQVLSPQVTPETTSSVVRDIHDLFTQSEEFFVKSQKSKYRNVSPQAGFLQMCALLEHSLAPKKMFIEGLRPSIGRAFFYQDLSESKLPDGLSDDYEHDATKVYYASIAHLWLKDRFPLEKIDTDDKEHIDMCNSLVDPNAFPHNLAYWHTFIQEMRTRDSEEIIDTPAARYFIEQDLSGELPSANYWHSRVQKLVEKKEEKKGSFRHHMWLVRPYRTRPILHFDDWSAIYYTYLDAAGTEHRLPLR